MYVCVCKGITEADIEQAVKSGEVTCMKTLKSCLGVSTQCGSCESDAERTLSTCTNKLLAQSAKSPSLTISTPIILQKG